MSEIIAANVKKLQNLQLEKQQQLHNSIPEATIDQEETGRSFVSLYNRGRKQRPEVPTQKKTRTSRTRNRPVEKETEAAGHNEATFSQEFE